MFHMERRSRNAPIIIIIITIIIVVVVIIIIIIIVIIIVVVVVMAPLFAIIISKCVVDIINVTIKSVLTITTAVGTTASTTHVMSCRLDNTMLCLAGVISHFHDKRHHH